tara:strand:- start:2282 stop:3475 length:1194 start_codon:yes stop_codon:yes gene_type:complete
MIHEKKTNTNIKFDILIIGAGPTGITLACEFANTNLKIAVIDKLNKKIISNPKADGREIALTNNSIKILKRLNVWNHISKKDMSIIKEARVLDGNSNYFLNFDHQEIRKDCLGYLIPNYIIKKNLYKKLKQIPNVTLIDNVECLSIKMEEKFATIILSNGEKIKSSLVVAADGRFSKLRSKMGISTFTRDFKKNMIVCRMKHEIPHKNIAYEFFRYNNTQATLPFVNNHSGIVTTANRDQSNNLIKMNQKSFNKEMENNFNNFFGKMKLVGKRYNYPMITTYTKKFISHRFALLGDAAVGMHPVTAHGFNLGLKGMEILSKVIKDAVKNNVDIGLKIILNQYQSELRKESAPVYFATNSIINLYTSNILPAKITRQFFLRFVNTVKPVKQSFLNILE